MEANEFGSIWAAYDAKLEKSIRLNTRIMEELKTRKIRSAFNGFLVAKIAEILIAAGCIFFFAWFTFAHFHEVHFAISGIVLLLFCIIALAGSIDQLILARQVQYSNGIAACQKKTALLQSAVLMQSSALRYTKIALLSLPLYTAWIIVGFEALFGFDIYAYGDQNWWIAQVVFSILLVPFSLWLFKKISYKNIHIKWVRRFIEMSGSPSIIKAMEYMKEIDSFTEEN